MLIFCFRTAIDRSSGNSRITFLFTGSFSSFPKLSPVVKLAHIKLRTTCIFVSARWKSFHFADFIYWRCSLVADSYLCCGCFCRLFPFLSHQLLAEDTSQDQRELCCPQTTPIITPEVRAAAMTSWSPGILVSILSIIIHCVAIFPFLSSQLLCFTHTCCPRS